HRAGQRLMTWQGQPGKRPRRLAAQRDGDFDAARLTLGQEQRGARHRTPGLPELVVQRGVLALRFGEHLKGFVETSEPRSLRREIKVRPSPLVVEPELLGQA